jgi:hypothetical protein
MLTKFWRHSVKSKLHLASLTSIALMLLASACSRQSAALEYKPYKSDADVPRMSVQDAKKEVDAGNAVIVDARGDVAWKMERIAGSLNIPSVSDEMLAKLPKGKKIIVYCS